MSILLRITFFQRDVWMSQHAQDLFLFRPGVEDAAKEQQLKLYGEQLAECFCQSHLDDVLDMEVQSILSTAENRFLIVYQSAFQLQVMRT